MCFFRSIIILVINYDKNGFESVKKGLFLQKKTEKNRLYLNCNEIQQLFEICFT